MSMTWPVPSFPPRVYTPGSVVNSVGAVERVAISGDGALIPDVYGRQRVPAEIVTPVVYDDDTLYILCVWCTGEIQAINGVYMGDVQIDAANLHNYRGTSGQSADTWMAAAIPGYADALTGIAYSVLKVTKAMGLNSRIWADISGRNDIYDPRTSSTGYSTNPSLCLANFIDRYLPVTVLNPGLIACANANDVTIGGVPRESLNITIRTPAPIETHAAVLSEYANCFIHWGPDVVLTPNRTKSADHVFTDATIKDLIVRKPGMDQQPNRVTVEYTDISGTEWKSALVTHSDIAPGAEVREQVLQMPGIQNYGHASRYAEERLNYYRQTDIRLTVSVFDEGASVIVGDRVTITHKYGLTARDFWVVAVEALDAGRYQIEAEGYSSSIYVTTNPTAPTLSDPAYPTENDYSTVKGMFTTYRQADPPASASLGDLWIDTDNNRMYRWDGAAWEEVQDDDIAQALADALAAQNTADARVSTWAQTSPPIANAEGDLWIETDDNNELHRWDGGAWVSQRDGTIAVAQADALQALADAAFAQATANSRITTFYNATPPAANVAGDLWFDTDDHRAYRWNGSAWVDIQDDDIAQALSDAADAQTTADGKIVTFAQTSQPAAAAVGDLWIETDDSNELHRWNGSAWVSYRDGTIATANANALQALADAATAQSAADSRTTTFYTASPPTANATGDLWFDTDNRRAHRWNGSSWIDLQDDDIAQALADAADAQNTADGKIVTFAQASPPTAAAVGDLWVETDDDNQLHRWSGSAWVNYRDGTISDAQADATQALANAATAQATANARATTFYSAGAPSANATGDLWFDTDDHRAYRWNGSSWIDLQDDDIAQALSDAATAQATADGKIVTFRQTSPPTADGQGDLWIDSDDNNRLYRWNGSSWVDNRDPVANWETIEDYAGMPQLIPNGLRHGGAMTITFNENKLNTGASNDGEIQVKAGRYRMPDGTIRTVAADIHVYTPWEGGYVPYDGNFCLMWGATNAHSRWAGDYGNTAGFFTIHEDRATGVKYVADNTVPNKAVYTPLSTDYLMAVGTKSLASGGIATLSPIPQVVGELALNALVSQSLVEDGAVVAASQSNFYTDSSFDSVPPSSLSGSTNQISTGTFRTPVDLTDTMIMLDFTFAVRCNFTYTGDTADDIAKYVQIFWKLYNGSANGTASDATTSVYLRCVKDAIAAGGIYKGFGYFTLQLPLDVSALSADTNYTPGLKIRYNSADSNYVFNPIQLSHRSGRAIIMNKSKPVVSGGWLM